jgi:hypothetical protein
MSSIKVSIIKNQEHVARNEIGAALINPDPALSPDVLMKTSDNADRYIPAFRNANQASGGQELYAPSLSSEGKLTAYLEMVPPAALSGTLAGVTKAKIDVSVTLTFTLSGQQRQAPLSARDQGNNIWELTGTFAGADLEALQQVLFDTVPSANLIVASTVRIAAQLSERFITTNWANEAIREGLKATFGSAIPFNSAAQFYSIVQQAYPDFPSEFMVMDCCYTSQIAMPPLPGFIQWQLTWDGRAYNYYQDNQQPNRVFFLPDSFQLAIEPSGSPTVSILRFTIPDGNDLEQAAATFRFFGSPIADIRRIEDARRQLASKLGRQPELVSLQYAHGVEKTLTISLPNAVGTASSPKLQPDAQIDLDMGLRNEVQLGFKAFQALWAAVFSDRPDQTIFMGWVDVGLSNGKFMNRISFVGRMPPATQANYFHEIIQVGSDVNYSTTLQVNVPAALLAATAEPQILAIELIFGPDATASFKAPSGNEHGPLLHSSVTLRRSVSDILLGNTLDGICRYTLKVVTLESARCCPKETTSNEIYVTGSDIRSCNKECS